MLLIGLVMGYIAATIVTILGVKWFCNALGYTFDELCDAIAHVMETNRYEDVDIEEVRAYYNGKVIDVDFSEAK